MVINGKLQDDIINESLDKFINRYIICKKCNLPEYFMEFPEGKELINACESCGHKEKYDSINRVTK